MHFPLCLSFLLIIIPKTLYAQTLNSGDSAWMLVSTVLVLFMTLPGLALFYAGLVRRGNVLSVLMQCFTITCIASLVRSLGWGRLKNATLLQVTLQH